MELIDPNICQDVKYEKKIIPQKIQESNIKFNN